MRNILNYETSSEMLTAGNIVPSHEYWLASTSYSKRKYIPSKSHPQTEIVLGPFNFKGMVSSPVPGVVYLKESGMTIYNNTKFPYINLDEKLGGDYESTKNFIWAELGITEDIYQAYKDEVNNSNPVCVLNITLQGNYCDRINTLTKGARIIFDEIGAILEINEDGTATYERSTK